MSWRGRLWRPAPAAARSGSAARGGPPGTSGSAPGRQSSVASWRRIAHSSSRSSAPGSMPIPSTSASRASWYERSASAWRPDRYCAVISSAHSRSRVVFAWASDTRSGARSTCRPVASSSSARSSSRGQPQLVQPHGVGLERWLHRQVAEGVTPPQGQRLAQPRQRARRGRPTRPRSVGVGEQGLETRGVDLGRRHVEQVARRPPHHSRRGASRLAGPQQLAQLRHVRPQRAGAGARRLVAPDRVDQGLGRNDAARPEDQVRQHRPLARPAERDVLTLPPHGQRTEDVKRELAVWHRRARPTVRPASGPRSPSVRTP